MRYRGCGTSNPEGARLGIGLGSSPVPAATAHRIWASRLGAVMLGVLAWAAFGSILTLPPKEPPAIPATPPASVIQLPSPTPTPKLIGH